MSNKCGYFSCYKGKPTCSHPEKGEWVTHMGNVGNYCQRCKRTNNGLYPSQLPTVRFSEDKIDVVDKDGNILS